MIHRKLSRLAALLMAASILGVAHAAPSTQASEGTQSSQNCIAGKAIGVWNLPEAGMPGVMRAVLSDDRRPRFRVRAMIQSDPASEGSSMSGTLMGMVEILTPDGPKPFGRLAGKWLAGPDLTGRYRAKILRPTATSAGSLRAVGEIRGSFDDTATRGPGRHKGRWKVCR